MLLNNLRSHFSIEIQLKLDLIIIILSDELPNILTDDMNCKLNGEFTILCRNLRDILAGKKNVGVTTLRTFRRSYLFL